MSDYNATRIFVVGGTGAQGFPVVRGLVADGSYHCKVLTRDVNSSRAKTLSQLPNVSFLESTFANEETLRAGYADCDGAFINIDGFNTGEMTEMFWAIRTYELALELGWQMDPDVETHLPAYLKCGIKFFVYGNLDYAYKKSGYDPKYRTSHYDGKGRIGEWVLHQNKDNPQEMGAAHFTTGPYIEVTIAKNTPMTPTIEDGVATWRVPLGDGAVIHVPLEDCAHYVRWLFDHPDRANGLDLEVAIAHIGYDDLAAALERVTGHPARYIDTDLETYWKSGPLSAIGDRPTGYNAGLDNMGSNVGKMTVRENFTGFWNMWRGSGHNEGVVRRDYALLDEIFPGRNKSAEEWLQREEERGIREGLGGLWDRIQESNIKMVIKAMEYGLNGRL